MIAQKHEAFSSFFWSLFSVQNMQKVDCRYNEKMQRIQRGLEGVVDELFTYSCPKFVAATPPRLDNLTVNSNQVQTCRTAMLVPRSPTSDDTHRFVD